MCPVDVCERTTVGDGPLLDSLSAHGFSRRQFVKYATGLAATLALPLRFGAAVAQAFASVERPRVVWLQFQDCTGDSESALRAGDPDIGELILRLVSWDYHEVLMAAAGEQATSLLDDAVKDGGYLCIVEGSIPSLEGACTIAGKSARQHLEEVGSRAAAIVNVGTCSAYGGIPRAHPNPTGALPTSSVVKGVPQINLPGCPVNAVTIVATVGHFLTFGSLPECDDRGRPKFAYAKRIHDTCERRRFFDAGMFADAWGDEGHRNGYCLYRLGCKGPYTWNNCPVAGWNGTNQWPVRAGHTCFGCSEPGFWDSMEPFYGRLPQVGAFGLDASPTTLGVGLLAATAGVFAVHGAGKAVQHHRHAAEAEAAPADATPAPGPEEEEKPQ